MLSKDLNEITQRTVCKPPGYKNLDFKGVIMFFTLFDVAKTQNRNFLVYSKILKT